MNESNVVYQYNGLLFRIKMNKMLKPSIVWMSLVNIMLNERCQAQRPHIVSLHLYEMSKIGKSTEVESD